METEPLINQILLLCQNYRGISFQQTAPYQAFLLELNKLHAQLAGLVDDPLNEELSETIAAIHELATDPTTHAEEFGFQEGFRAALLLRLELDRFALDAGR